MAISAAFKKLFEPVRIGQMHIRNRIVMPGMNTGLSTEDGYVTQQMKDYYEERAKGGVGLIIVEINCVDFPRGKAVVRQLAIDDDKFIPGLRELAQVIQKHGAKAALGLHHAGNAAKQAITHLQPVGPSAIARPGGEVPRELTTSEIGNLVGHFAKAAKRAKGAGFDGVEIHAAHAYLIAQFLSSAWNRREDNYGGALNNRARFLLEILQAIREVVGKSYPVWCRINGEENGIPDGITLREAQDLAKMLEEAGADAINVSASALTMPSHRPYFFPPGWAAHLAAGVKKVVDVPVMAVGRLGPELGERLLREGKADFIVMGRPLRVDPELPNKVASGRIDDIIPCIACNACDSKTPRPNDERLCAVNAAIGREREYKITLAKKKRQVLIIGGGPAGMEAARVAALRGHKVSLLTKEPRLGGLLTIASLVNTEIYNLNKYLIAQIKKLGVKVILGREVTLSLIDDLKPDAIILATGATPLLPDIPGIDGGNVLSHSLFQTKVSDQLKKLLSIRQRISWREFILSLGAVALRLFGVSFVRWLLGLGIGFGKRIVIIGNELAGCEMAEFFNQKGKRVTVVELPESIIAGEMPKPMPTLRQYLLFRLAQRGVPMLTNVKIEEVAPKGLVISTKEGERQTIPADIIVLTPGLRPNTQLFQGLKDKAYEVYVAGDCSKPSGILEAIDDGARIARVV